MSVCLSVLPCVCVYMCVFVCVYACVCMCVLYACVYTCALLCKLHPFAKFLSKMFACENFTISILSRWSKWLLFTFHHINFVYTLCRRPCVIFFVIRYRRVFCRSLHCLLYCSVMLVNRLLSTLRYVYKYVWEWCWCASIGEQDHSPPDSAGAEHRQGSIWRSVPGKVAVAVRRCEDILNYRRTVVETRGNHLPDMHAEQRKHLALHCHGQQRYRLVFGYKRCNFEWRF